MHKTSAYRNEKDKNNYTLNKSLEIQYPLCDLRENIISLTKIWAGLLYTVVSTTHRTFQDIRPISEPSILWDQKVSLFTETISESLWRGNGFIFLWFGCQDSVKC